MYCPECGTKIDDDCRFCPECGTQIVSDEEETAVQPSQPVAATPQATDTAPFANPSANVEEDITEPDPVEPQEGKEDPLPEPVCWGLILTNVKLLALKFNVTEDQLLGVFKQFIHYKRTIGISYQLIDAGNYTYHKHGFFSKPKTVSLTANDSWSDYGALLMDMHEYEVSKKLPESQYLFIVGSEDIVPMPAIRTYLSKEVEKDRTIDTDLLYAYPYGPEMLQKLETLDIYRYEALFYVGRLPLATDATVEDLVSYLNRDIACQEGIPVDEMYAHCDMNWKNTTAHEVKVIREQRLFPVWKVQFPQNSYYNDLFLSPPLRFDTDNKEFMTQRFFNIDANLFLFNLHGCPTAHVGHYSASYPNHKDWVDAVHPKFVQQCKYPNIMVSQACYGGRFIGEKKDTSMIMSALSNQTLAFVASSRSAWGSVDCQGSTPDNAPMAFSDVLASYFLQQVLMGMSVGMAFFNTRSYVFQYRGDGNPQDAVTIAEFNLFGDPTLFGNTDVDIQDKAQTTAGAKVSRPLGTNQKSASKIASARTAFSGGNKAPLAKPDQKLGVKTEVLQSKAAGGQQSLLDQVRSQVDANMIAICKTMGQHLYAQYGIEAREPSCVLRDTYPDGHREIKAMYDDMMVSADEHGKVLEVSALK